MRRSKWCNEEVQKAVVAKKVAYRKMLEVETEEARRKYIEAKREAKKVVIGELRLKSGMTLVGRWKRTPMGGEEVLVKTEKAWEVAAGGVMESEEYKGLGWKDNR